MLHAHAGDHIVIRGHRVGQPDHDGQVVETRGPDGTPPFLVRWANTDHETLLFPGTDAVIEAQRPGVPARPPL